MPFWKPHFSYKKRKSEERRDDTTLKGEKHSANSQPRLPPCSLLCVIRASPGILQADPSESIWALSRALDDNSSLTTTLKPGAARGIPTGNEIILISDWWTLYLSKETDRKIIRRGGKDENVITGQRRMDYASSLTPEYLKVIITMEIFVCFSENASKIV